MSTTLEILRDAIVRKKPVSFRYKNPKKPNEPKGARIGNPHAVYQTTTGNINLDLYQTSGAILPAGTELPAWRDYTLTFISDLEIIEGPSFEVASDYKSYARKYQRKFVKI